MRKVEGGTRPSFPEISIPSLIPDFELASRSNVLLGKAHRYCATGKFTDDRGKVDEIGNIGVTTDEGALLHHLVKLLDPRITIETGFGAGASACVFVGSKKAGSWRAKNLHMSIDPHGLGGGQGKVVGAYLAKNHGKEFRRVREPSEIALPRLVAKYEGKIKLSLIDGGHLFENALIDFVFLDRMCAVGGCILLDDATQPPVESALNYIEANKINYVVQRPANSQMALLWKAEKDDHRDWDHFRPFKVSDDGSWRY